MTHLYPALWVALGFGIYHMIGTYSVAKRKLFSGGDIDAPMLLLLKKK